MTQENRTTIANTLSSILNWIFVGVAFLSPLFFLPVTSEILFLNKHFLLFLAAGLALVLWTVNFIVRGKVTVTVSPLLVPLIVLVAAYVASAWMGTSPLPEALIGRLGLVVTLFLLLVVGTSRPQRVGNWLKAGLMLSATTLGLLTVLTYTGALSALGLPAWLADKTFTPAGTTTTLLIVLLAALPLLTEKLRAPKKSVSVDGIEAASPASETTAQALAKLGTIVAIVAVVSGAVISGIVLFPGQETAPSRMPVFVGWQIAIETLKQQPFFGVGPGGYLAAYTQYRPISSNTGNIWNQRFQQGPNELLHTFTETGLVGLLALLFVIFGVWKLANLGDLSHIGRSGTAAALSLLLISLLLAPLNVVTFALLAILMIIVTLERKGTDAVYNATIDLVALREGVVRVDRIAEMAEDRPIKRYIPSSVILAWVIFVPSALAALSIFYFTSKAFSAEVSYRQALEAIIANDGLTAYNKLIETTSRNPWFDNYHRQFADVNLRLANSLAAQQNLSDQDRANVNQLVQQSIREGKIATEKDPMDVRNWETLATTYRALISVAAGSQDWTILSYSEAIRRDPVNPLLRVTLGGVFYNARDWESAIRTFQAAANLKPDYANAYYNLALAYEQDGRPREAVRAMQATIQNLDANSPDYPAAQSKLEELVKKAQGASGDTALETDNNESTSQDAAEEERLSAPTPFPTPLPGANRVELGEEEAPPITPTPTAEPTAEPTP